MEIALEKGPPGAGCRHRQVPPRYGRSRIPDTTFGLKRVVTRKQPNIQRFAACSQPLCFNTRSVVAGLLTSFSNGLLGRATSSPPQFGHLFFNKLVVQSLQKVHSKEQILASVDSGGKSLSQHSQFGRNCSIIFLMLWNDRFWPYPAVAIQCSILLA